VKLKINSIGDFATREQYQKILYNYFKPQIFSLCDDCKRRLEKNPMRILDCKVDMESPVLKKAPKISQSLSQASTAYFKEVLSALEYFQIPYETDENLVRGLDYYTDTVFEFIIADDEELGGLAICAGGRYSNMVSSFGGPEIPGIGYAFGVERIMALMEAKHLFPELTKAADAVIIALDPESKKAGLKLAGVLRDAGYYIEMDYTNISMKQQFKLSDRVSAKLLIIIGEEERMNSRYTIKNNNTKTQETVESEKLFEYLKENLQ
jgi:histidyl-tRNA synthetase